MKCTPANFIGHLWTKSSMKITFHCSQKCISPIWVGFVKQSIGILWLLYQLLHAIKWFLGLNNWNGPVIPGRIGHVQKTSIWTQPLVKSREIQFLNFSLLWGLETTIFSQPYPFLWLSSIPKQTIFKKEKKNQIFWKISWFFKKWLLFQENGT